MLKRHSRDRIVVDDMPNQTLIHRRSDPEGGCEDFVLNAVLAIFLVVCVRLCSYDAIYPERNQVERTGRTCEEERGIHAGSRWIRSSQSEGTLKDD